jgi:Domain of unknown function (DUF4276)
MKELVFLLEERSAKALLESLLPRVLPPEIGFRLIPFEGKQDLEKQASRKIRGYQNTQARFVLLRDQDNHPDCHRLKQDLLDLCAQSGKAERCLVRLACTELETFYLADLAAVERALGMQGLARQQASKKFRNPDRLGNASKELRALTKQRYEKVAGSGLIGHHLALDNERSPSFKNLMGGIRRVAQELAALED